MIWSIFDVETTGFTLPSSAKLEDQPRIIEIGLVLVCDRKVVRESSWLVNPGVQITDEITKITGITNDQLRPEPEFASLAATLCENFLGVGGLIAHNLPFDRAMLVNELRRIGQEFSFPYPPQQICTVATYEHLKGRRMKLTELYKEVIGRELAQTHRALDDARALAEICIAEELCE